MDPHPPLPNEYPEQSLTTRVVHCAEAVEWLDGWPATPSAAFVSSLPDVTETSLSLGEWRSWFRDAVARILDLCPDDSAAIFYQTDIKVDGLWIDKGHLCQCGADAAGVPLLWHKIACRKPAGTLSFGRPAYSHMLCFSRGLRPAPQPATPDVLPTTGRMIWSRAIGLEAALMACRWIVQHTRCRTIVDPFCGHGTVLAVANLLGLDAIGVDRSPRRCRKARALRVTLPEIAPLRQVNRRILGGSGS